MVVEQPANSGERSVGRAGHATTRVVGHRSIWPKAPPLRPAQPMEFHALSYLHGPATDARASFICRKGPNHVVAPVAGRLWR